MHETPTPNTTRTRKRGGTPKPGARQAKARERIAKGATVARLTVLSEMHGVPTSTSRDAAARGAFPVARLGTSVYVRPADFARWLDNQFATVS